MLKTEYTVIGVMSGTSLDGIDIIYVTYKLDAVWNFKIHNAETYTYPKIWKSKLSNLVKLSETELKKTDALYTEFLAETIKAFMRKNNIKNIDFVSSHGHTALHMPERKITYQIGNLQVLSNMLQQNIICDFRTADVLLGGQGAPLVPIGDELLFQVFDFCLNLGGFANVSFKKNNQRIAFDICPVNIVLNHYASQLNLDYDDKGKLAASGVLNETLLSALNKVEFYKQQPPKSLGLEWVENTIFPIINSFDIEISDILRTVVEHVALQISEVLNKKNTTVLITGGGAYNRFLIRRIEGLSRAKITIPESEIIEFKEALIFGLLGVLKDRNEINCLKSVTGATHNHSSGKILKPLPLNSF